MTPQDAAEWLLEQFNAKGFLYQEEAASHLYHLQDGSLTYFDGNGNLCIGKPVLAIFNKLTPDAVYERGDKLWRNRLLSDLPGRQQ